MIKSVYGRCVNVASNAHMSVKVSVVVSNVGT